MEYKELINGLVRGTWICANNGDLEYAEFMTKCATAIKALSYRCTRLEEARERANEACAKWEARAEQLEKERDAAISDLETAMAYGGTYNCQFCRNAQCLVRGGTKPCLPKWRGTKEG